MNITPPAFRGNFSIEKKHPPLTPRSTQSIQPLFGESNVPVIAILTDKSDAPYDLPDFKAAAARKNLSLIVIDYRDCILRVDSAPQNERDRFKLFYREDGKTELKELRSEDISVVLPRVTITATNGPAIRDILKQFEKNGIPSVNSFDAIDHVNDKFYTHQLLAENQIPMLPVSMTSSNKKVLIIPTYRQVSERGKEIIIKAPYSTDGKGVIKRPRTEAINDYQKAVNNNENPFFQPISRGSVAPDTGQVTDYRVLITGDFENPTIVGERRTSPHGSIISNQDGHTFEAIDPSTELGHLAKKVRGITGLEVLTMDVFDTNEYKPSKNHNWIVSEVNTSPAGLRHFATSLTSQRQDLKVPDKDNPDASLVVHDIILDGTVDYAKRKGRISALA